MLGCIILHVLSKDWVVSPRKPREKKFRHTVGHRVWRVYWKAVFYFAFNHKKSESLLTILTIKPTSRTQGLVFRWLF